MSITIGYPVWSFPSSTTFSYIPRMVNVGFCFTQLVATLGPNSKDGHHRFQAAEEIAKLSGCVPVVRESGKWKNVSLRYACVKSLRRTFHDWAFTSINYSAWARAFYDYHKERNQSHCTLLRNLGKKWTKILFAVWSQGTSYDETLHIQNLKARMSLGLWLCNP